jgi:hypothetical protein
VPFYYLHSWQVECTFSWSHPCFAVTACHWKLLGQIINLGLKPCLRRSPPKQSSLALETVIRMRCGSSLEWSIPFAIALLLLVYTRNWHAQSMSMDLPVIKFSNCSRLVNNSSPLAHLTGLLSWGWTLSWIGPTGLPPDPWIILLA